MKRPVSALFFAWLCAPVFIWAAEGEPTQSEYSVPEAVTDLLTATGESGATVVTGDARAYFENLPAHAKRLTANAVAEEMITTPEHLSLLLSLELSSQKLDLVMQDNCILCHTDAEFQDTGSLFTVDPSEPQAHLNLTSFFNSVHFRHGLSCAGCHGGDPTGWMDHDHPDMWPGDTDKRGQDRTWVPEFCGRCHSDSTLMRQFNPGLPTDQLDKFEDSRHGKVLLGQKDSRAAECTSCHGLHDIMRSTSPRSKVHPARVHETCGSCHSDQNHMAGYTLADGSPLPTDQASQYLTSIHGRALIEKGDLGAATCNDCHGNHAALPPEVASVSQICRTCHAANGILFDGSRHKEKFKEHGWPECGACHGNHAITEATDSMLGDGAESMCLECHATYAKNNPDCAATAEYFYESITKLTGARERFALSVEELGDKGVDVELIDARLSDLDDSIRQARSYIHAFNLSDFQEVHRPGQETVRRLGELVEEGEKVHETRRRGLFVSIGLLSVLALFLYLKLRSLERSQVSRRP